MKCQCGEHAMIVSMQPWCSIIIRNYYCSHCGKEFSITEDK
jgi:hypothetical protein